MSERPRYTSCHRLVRIRNGNVEQGHDARVRLRSIVPADHANLVRRLHPEGRVERARGHAVDVSRLVAYLPSLAGPVRGQRFAQGGAVHEVRRYGNAASVQVTHHVDDVNVGVFLVLGAARLDSTLVGPVKGLDRFKLVDATVVVVGALWNVVLDIPWAGFIPRRIATGRQVQRLDFGRDWRVCERVAQVKHALRAVSCLCYDVLGQKVIVQTKLPVLAAVQSSAIGVGEAGGVLFVHQGRVAPVPVSLAFDNGVEEGCRYATIIFCNVIFCIARTFQTVMGFARR
mmetsp:Transcript_55692/g.118454  ORF Transcript_55692/g.118454 Transcript_55692/m.118454 type:complete len:286 (-) Transcript_55692:572-1429(-)